ncbi:hypothetical protein RSP_0048 [Pseudomonas phage RSP]|nr:hypothetical protein RSP_0048 [Pseudomonas phage RSP]
MKYVMFEKRMSDGCSHMVPVIFPNTLVHDEVANALTLGPLKGYIPCSAGEISPLDMQPHGESTTLGLKADEERDETVIRLNDYGGAFIG